MMNESVNLYNQLTGTKAYNTLLDGIYVSNTGDPAGPWNRIADSTKLANSGSALKQSIGGKGYGPGVQAWYNQFLAVDPTNADHVYAGLEEVYETQNAGASWTTTGPYWNFYFSCWRPDSLYPPNGNVGCPQSTHSDQHSVAFGTVGGKAYVYVGNDGGIYRRPGKRHRNRNGNGTDWESLNDGTIDALQYYYVGVGTLNADDAARPDLNTGGDSVLVSGGLQDNGGSLIRPGSPKMVSNFGGDGGDVLVDPADGCNIVQEYVYLSMRVTKTCANPGPGHPNAFLDLSDATTTDISPPDVNAQFIAPFTANDKNINQWLAAGTSLWYQDKGFGITSGSQWQKVYSLPSADQTFTAVSYSGNRAFAPGAARARTAARPSPAAPSSALRRRHVDVQGGRVPGRLPEPLPPGRGDRPEEREPPDRGRQRVLAPLHRGPGRRHRPHLRVEGRRPDLDGHLGELPRHPGQRRRLAPERRSPRGDRSRSPLSRPGVGHVAAARQPAAGHGRDGPDARPRRQRLRGDARSRHLAHLGRGPLGRSDITARASGPPPGGPLRLCG